MFSRLGAAAFKKDLTNISILCEHLGNPHFRFKSIHIAGTNGKGSVSHMLAAILQNAGYKTGLYTSPHLKDFRERIKVNGNMISEEFVIDFTERIKPVTEKTEPSFFEITVAMAFEYFSQQKVDVAVIETGLGGRLDSTNIITPVLSVITNIGYDHMDMLGDTLEKIAFEKAGIIKQNIPVIIGETMPETFPVFKRTADEKNAPLILADEKRKILGAEVIDNSRLSVVLDEAGKEHHLYCIDLPGLYQSKNMLTVLASCDQLISRGFAIGQKHIEEGLAAVKKTTGLHGRWDVLKKSPLVVLDVAHNADGIRQLLQQLEETTYEKLHVIIGLVKDKDIDSLLSLLPANAFYYFTRAQIPRALPEELLQKKAARFNLKGNTYSTVNTALYAASLKASKNDLILICGSLFVAGEVSMEAVKEIWGKDEYSTRTWDAFEMAAWTFFR